jgi:hypothetical protein
MAITLPSKSYNARSLYGSTDTGYSLSIGTTFVNQSTVGAYEGVCTKQEGDFIGDGSACMNCCLGEYETCKSNGGSILQCAMAKEDCNAYCEYLSLGEERNPLDAPVFFLLALIAAYGAVVVYRRKMQEA